MENFKCLRFYEKRCSIIACSENSRERNPTKPPLFAKTVLGFSRVLKGSGAPWVLQLIGGLEFFGGIRSTQPTMGSDFSVSCVDMCNSQKNQDPLGNSTSMEYELSKL